MGCRDKYIHTPIHLHVHLYLHIYILYILNTYIYVFTCTHKYIEIHACTTLCTSTNISYNMPCQNKYIGMYIYICTYIREPAKHSHTKKSPHREMHRNCDKGTSRPQELEHSLKCSCSCELLSAFLAGSKGHGCYLKTLVRLYESPYIEPFVYLEYGPPLSSMVQGSSCASWGPRNPG